MAFIPQIFVAILAFLLRIMPGMLVTLFKLIGLAVVTYVGLDLGIDAFWDYVLSNFSGLPVHVAQILDLAGARSGLQMIMSTAVAIYTFQMTHKLRQKILLRKKSTFIA